MTWTAERYFTKASNYWQLATSKERDSEEFLLNLSFFCEFLVRGAICTQNPSLNASNDEESILYSAGIKPNKPPKSVPANVALSRLSRLIPEITTTEYDTLNAFFSIRNTELHSDEDGISTVSQSEIIPHIYSFISKVSNFAELDLSTLLNDSDAKQVKKTAEALLHDRQKRVKDLIKVQKDRFYTLPESEQDSKREASKSQFVSATTTSGHYLRTQKCPACSQEAILGGSPIGYSEPILREDGIFREIRIVPDVLECKCCGLKINGLDELMAAGVDHEFVAIDHVDVVEHFGIDPLEYVDTEEIAREYYDDQYGYQDE
ncbi:MAG: hypothetical protein P8P30_10170 [Rickettsiales bacterium]|nr:hypothetical protein [Rickettsiales bacterium]